MVVLVFVVARVFVVVVCTRANCSCYHKQAAENLASCKICLEFLISKACSMDSAIEVLGY